MEKDWLWDRIGSGRRMGQETIELDSGGGAVQRMVKGNVRSLELVSDSREGSREGREEGKLEVGLVRVENKAQVRSKKGARVGERRDSRGSHGAGSHCQNPTQH